MASFPTPLFPSGKTGWCCNILHQLCVWCDQIISSYCSILKTCQFLQQKKKSACYAEDVFSEITTEYLQLLEMEVSYLSRFRQRVFQEQPKYRETTKEINKSHNLILTLLPSPQEYIKYITGEQTVDCKLLFSFDCHCDYFVHAMCTVFSKLFP